MKNIVSIIVPIYKIPYDALKKCIESLLGQTHKNCEIILIDDGSPDKCGEICDRYYELDKSGLLKVVHKKNAGVSDARNTGLELAVGKYVMFVDADDYLYKSAVEDMLNIAETNAADIVVCDYERFFSEDVQFKECKNKSIVKTFDKKEDLKILRSKCLREDDKLGIRFNGAPWGKMYRLELLKSKNLYFDTTLVRSQDNLFNFIAFGLANKICYTNSKYYYYRYLPNSSVNKFRKNLYEISDNYIRAVKKTLEKENQVEEYQEILYRVKEEKLIEFCHVYAAHPDNKETYKEKCSAIKRAYKNWIIIPEAKYKNDVHSINDRILLKNIYNEKYKSALILSEMVIIMRKPYYKIKGMLKL